MLSLFQLAMHIVVGCLSDSLCSSAFTWKAQSPREEGVQLFNHGSVTIKILWRVVPSVEPERTEEPWCFEKVVHAVRLACAGVVQHRENLFRWHRFGNLGKFINKKYAVELHEMPTK